MFETRVYYSEKERANIPTYGLPTSVNDLYRAQALVKSSKLSNHGIVYKEEFNDIALFENEIKSFDDVLKFETMLRFVLLKDGLSVYEPSVRYSIENEGYSNFESYSRIPDYKMQSANHVFSSCGAVDHLFPVEKITIKDGVVKNSTAGNSQLIGLSQSEIGDALLKNKLSNDIIRKIPLKFSMPFVYGSGDSVGSYSDVYNDFFTSLDSEFSEVTKYNVKSEYNIALPFFTNSILSIAKNRDDIPNAIIELRGVLTGLRVELCKYEYEFSSISSPIEQANRTKELEKFINSCTVDIYNSGSRFSSGMSLLFDNLSIVKLISTLFKGEATGDKLDSVLFRNSNHKVMKGLVSRDNISTNITNFLGASEISKLRL
tara:strand:+ start:276 stop:1397 length:1122 start_codon:yes stop_codon:yes gene_type:complete